MDWLSLTQVKEMGVALEGAEGFEPVRDLRKLFDRWWIWTAPGRRSPSRELEVLWDPSLQVKRPVPCWEYLGVNYFWSTACTNPFPEYLTTAFNAKHPMPLVLNESSAGSFFSCSPPGVCDVPRAVNSMYAEEVPGRQWDGDSLVKSILSAEKTVCLSVMDFAPASMYRLPFDPVYWPMLNDALLAKVRQGVRVRLLISRWAHTDPSQWSYLEALLRLAHSCSAPTCVGRLEVRAFEIPGWRQTEGAQAEFPPFTRVNHAKYIVTDQRFNIGTSNMVWGYFHNTAGASFNSDHTGLRAQLQAAFDRDWNSHMAVPIPTPQQLNVATGFIRSTQAEGDSTVESMV